MQLEQFRLGNEHDWIIGYKCIPIEPIDALPIVISHGFGTNNVRMRRYAEKFCDLGYEVYVFDYRGGDIDCESSGRTEEMTIESEKQDLKKVIDYVIEQSVKHSQVTLWGCSLGGVIASLVATEYQKMIDKLILYYPAFSVSDDLNAGELMGSKFEPKKIPDKVFIEAKKFDIGREFISQCQKLDIWNEVMKYKGPVLICHGTDDTKVDISYGRKAAEIYSDAEFIEIPSGDHGYRVAGFNEAIQATKKYLSI